MQRQIVKFGGDGQIGLDIEAIHVEGRGGGGRRIVDNGEPRRVDQVVG